ncbi:terpene cyclase/mutase family protein [Nocardioides sp. zg-536]|uniref:Terpene cyclase/mutase family protein n=1 Tax=Nocardioides faecalis TaxID=2803858 RepID=A0A938Y858_9ACTN|nr:prenyltransferase/squalene oxidase repeat-containing protein [Nocardioides faecalis]MBM9459261.1 terpene cyclase/mutase family protein [Nocardioides faecalis]QVI59608.1 terpene cyclase/mutase family protein [Nocardioides faecalis]
MSPRTARTLSAAGLSLALLLTGCGREDDDKRSAASDPASGSATGSGAEPGTPQAALAGARWLEGELTDGVLRNRQYGTDDLGSTIDLAYALRAVDPDSDALPAIADVLVAGAAEYASPGEDVYAGSTAKLLSFAADTGADPRDFAGIDLLAQLEERIEDAGPDAGPTAGRAEDKSSFGDYANSFGQAWAVRGLTLAGSEEAEAARDYLLQQQCSAGFFRLYFPDAAAADQTCDGAGAAPEPVDTTALAYVLLHDLAEDDATLDAALRKGIDYILDQQAEDGSFSGGDGAVVPNANSTGLAGWALHLAGEDEAAAQAAAWVRGRQLGECEGVLARDAGAIAFDDTAVRAAGKKGLTKTTEGQWRAATIQALPALLATPDGADEAPCPAGS